MSTNATLKMTDNRIDLLGKQIAQQLGEPQLTSQVSARLAQARAVAMARAAQQRDVQVVARGVLAQNQHARASWLSSGIFVLALAAGAFLATHSMMPEEVAWHYDVAYHSQAESLEEDLQMLQDP